MKFDLKSAASILAGVLIVACVWTIWKTSGADLTVNLVGAGITACAACLWTPPAKPAK